MPLVSMKGASIVGISTPLGTDNILYYWKEKRNRRGQRMFLTYQIVVRCLRCEAEDLDTNFCNHPGASNIPAWHSEQGRADAEDLLGEGANRAREMGGEFANLCKEAYTALSIQRFVDRPRYSGIGIGDQFVDTVYCCIDPAAGGQNSAYTAVWAYKAGPLIVVSDL